MRDAIQLAHRRYFVFEATNDNKDFGTKLLVVNNFYYNFSITMGK